MNRLLCILNNMNAGGAETFLMKIYRNIDRTKYQMDFCINVHEKCFYEDEIYSLGGKVYRITSKTDNYSLFKKELSELIKKEKYKHVLRITSNAMGFLDLKIAKKAGAKVCCARSSNSSDGNSFILKLMHFIGRIIYLRYVDIALAPSELAAKYTFGKKHKNVNIINNAVDLDFYQYMDTKRAKIRVELGVSEDTVIIGHIGRFMEQKNHAFLADIFNQVNKLNNNTKLLLVGDGPLRAEFEKQIVQYGLDDKVKYLGIRRDIPDILSAMDVFVFPSFYEGMPNTIIEAQATGLPCVISDTITKEANITGLVEYISLNNTPECWAIHALNKVSSIRKNTKEIFIKKEYDVSSSAHKFIDVIFCSELGW